MRKQERLPNCQTKVIVIMGVSGSGKTTISKCLADAIGWQFIDADLFHPSANIDKMIKGVALTDEDRAPWLATIKDTIALRIANDQRTVLACSALKDVYRHQLQNDSAAVCFVYLKGDYELFAFRLQKRESHFMKAKMLASQFDTLEEPTDALQVDASKSPGEIVADIRREFQI